MSKESPTLQFSIDSAWKRCHHRRYHWAFERSWGKVDGRRGCVLGFSVCWSWTWKGEMITKLIQVQVLDEIGLLRSWTFSFFWTTNNFRWAESGPWEVLHIVNSQWRLDFWMSTVFSVGSIEISGSRAQKRQLTAWWHGLLKISELWCRICRDDFDVCNPIRQEL